MDNDPQPLAILDDPWFTDALLGEIRDLTRVLYPEARIPETAMPDVTAKFPGRATYSLGQHNQTIELKYAHDPATTQDVTRMVELLQSLANDLLRELGKAELLP